MLALASRFTARLLASTREPALWSISTGHGIVGTLVCEAGEWRLAWFAGADPRLANYAGPLGGDVEALAAALGARLGVPVELQSLSV